VRLKLFLLSSLAVVVEVEVKEPHILQVVVVVVVQLFMA
jgi:hypothetical protein